MGISPEEAKVVKDGLQALRAMQGTAVPPPPADLTLTTQAPPKAKAKAKRAPDPARIPPRAWAAADYMRSRLVTEDPACFVARQPWDVSKQEGLRLKWADSFRLMHEVDRREFDEIAKVVSWLFNQPIGAPRFVVQSPDSLREKWDRIQAVRRNKSAPQQRPGGDNRPPPEFKRWDSDGGWNGDKP